MSWSNIKLIYLREVRDQLRDRRTLFMIAVLPMLLYPLMGMVLLQVLQFRREHPTRIWLIGAGHLPDEPKLLEGDEFTLDLRGPDSGAMELTVTDTMPADVAQAGLRATAQDAIASGTYDAVIFFPPHFDQELNRFREQIRNIDGSDTAVDDEQQLSQVPTPEIFINTADDKSRVAQERMDGILYRWRQAVVAKNLEARQVPKEATTPFKVVNTDVAEEHSRRAAIWSRLLPFVVLVWALTGAFYPAIDLCAGEKERGTLETLLSSPAQRSEIVWGKLLTVMSFSVVTSLLNLGSLAGTSGFVITQMQHIGGSGGGFELGPPPLAPLPWLIVGLLPLSALFSALSLAIAAFAKSSKEGQYYLMPLLMFTLPLLIFPMMPATELELGTAIIPVTGVIFLLRELMEGQYVEALRYSVPVLIVTAICCLLAIRWAIDQFNNESVLFRESERWDLWLWLKSLVRDRGETPTIGAAILCGVLILVARFFVSLISPMPTDLRGFVFSVLVTLVGWVALPALAMALLLTRNPRKTLSLYWPRWQMLPFAVLLAVLLHPVAGWLAYGIQELYPIGADAHDQLNKALAPLEHAPLWLAILLVAVTPAICEELAFRGFILSGMRHTGHRWLAVAVSSAFFGITHSLLQQSLAAAILGCVIGYLVLRTGSLLTGVLFHLTHNSLQIAVPSFLFPDGEQLAWSQSFIQKSEAALLYHPWLSLACGALAAGMLYWLHRQPYAAFEEERLQQALDHQTPLTAKPQWRFW